MASSNSKQHRSSPEPADARATKRSRADIPTGSAGPLRVVLNPADCDLDFDIEGNGLQGHALHEQGFAYCWSGARANVGITGGKYCFGCKIIADQVVDMADTPSDQQHVCRVGISRGDDPVGNLGETLHSFGFGGTGKFSNAGKFTDYGTKFGVGDTIVCCVNLENRALATIGFCKNGKWLGVAYQFDASSRGLGVVDTPLKHLPWESALFPHVLLKNVVVELQFSIEDGLVPEDGYKPWNSAIVEGNVIIGPSFFNPQECEVLMLVGLPASGKTTWAERWVNEHPEKRYVILGTNLALDQMKVPGLLRKQNYGERFDRLMDRATGIFNTMLARAAKTPRNYILDQTNVYKNARNRKLKAFLDFRKVAVVVFPTPEELKFRADKRFKEMGKDVPQDAINEMLANYVLPLSKDMPGSNELFDEVIFTELSRGEAQSYLDEMKRALKSPSNLNVNTDISPYSRESSIQSFSGPVATNKYATSVVGGHCLSPWLETPIPHYGFNPLQVSRARQGETNFSLPSNSPHGRYLDNDTTPFQSDGINLSWSSSLFTRNPPERSFSSVPDTSCYYTNKETANPRNMSFENPSSMGRASYGYQSDPPLYYSPSAHLHDTRVHRDGFQRPGDHHTNFISRSSHNNPSGPPSYSSPSAHLHMPGVSPVDLYGSRTLLGERRSPHLTTYGTPSASSGPQPPYATPPPVNHPYGPRFY